MATLYQRASDKVGGTATITVNTGTEDTDYPKANLVDGYVWQPAKLTTKTGSWVVNFGSAQRVDVASIAYHNLDGGLAVKLQANASDSWGSPTIDATFTIPGATADGKTSMPWLDVTGVTGYATGGFQYWRLLVSGTNTSNVSVGELGLWTPKRTVGRGVRPSFKTQDEFREIRHETEYGVIHRYRLGVRRRHWTGTVTASQADLDDLRAWYRDAAAQAGPALWIPDSTVNDCYWVRLPAEGPDVTSQYPAYHEVQLDLVEESGGGL